MTHLSRADDLSEREREVLASAAEGLTDKEIARHLGIGPKTVRTYWDRIRHKLGAASRTQAVSMSMRDAFASVQQNASRFVTVAEQMPALCIGIDEGQNIVYTNESARRTLGFDARAFGDTRRFLNQAFEDTSLRETVWERWFFERTDFAQWEIPMRTADGRTRRVAWTSLANGNPLDGWARCCVGIDVTDRHETVRALQASEETLRTIVECADQGMWLLKPDFTTSYANNHMAVLLNTTVRDLYVKTPLDFISEEDRLLATQLISAGGGSRIPFRFLRCDGTFIPVTKSLIPCKSDGEIVSYLIIASERGSDLK